MFIQTLSFCNQHGMYQLKPILSQKLNHFKLPDANNVLMQISSKTLLIRRSYWYDVQF